MVGWRASGLFLLLSFDSKVYPPFLRYKCRSILIPREFVVGGAQHLRFEGPLAIQRLLGIFRMFLGLMGLWKIFYTNRRDLVFVTMMNVRQMFV